MSDEQKARWGGPKFINPVAKHRALISVTSQLVEIVRTGVPLVAGLRMASVDAPSAELRDLFLSIHEGIVRGESLSKSMERLGDFFPTYYIALVETAEESGSPERTLGVSEEDLVRSAAADPRDNYVGSSFLWLLR